jgi:hypothetical protein
VKRRRHGLDLLPLLDVFMVVLFVFATISERRLGESADELAALRDELAALRARPPGLDPAEAERLQQAGAASDAAARTARDELARADDERLELRAALERLRRAAEAAAATRDLGGAEVLRRQEVLARLLDHFSVFEIEIDGELAGDLVVNHCCYRSEPLEDAWRACGQVPAAGGELADWLASGGAGLVDALRRTRGGNALTIVRQNERATWRIGRKLEEQLRDRFPDHKIYGEGVAAHSLACPR